MKKHKTKKNNIRIENEENIIHIYELVTITQLINDEKMKKRELITKKE